MNRFPIARYIRPFPLLMLLWGGSGFAAAKDKFDIFEPSIAAFFGLDLNQIRDMDDVALSDLLAKKYRTGTRRWHPDFERVRDSLQSDPRLKAWVAAFSDLAKVDQEAAIKKLENLAFGKVTEAKRACDLWQKYGRSGAPHFLSGDPVLNHEAWVAKQATSSGGAGSTSAIPPFATFLGDDFDYLRQGNASMPWRPKQSAQKAIRNPNGSLKFSTAVYDADTSSWFEIVTGTTFVWDAIYDGYVNFELGMYFIPATDVKEGFIYDPYEKREFSPHLNGWFAEPIDLKKKTIPKNRMLAGGQMALALPGAVSVNAKEGTAKSFLALAQGRSLSEGTRPLPTHEGGQVFGFYVGGARSGFGGLSAEPDPSGPIPEHREPDIIEAGLRYVETLPETDRQLALKLMEAQLRSIDQDLRDGHTWTKDCVVEFLELTKFWTRPDPKKLGCPSTIQGMKLLPSPK
jgi:hypothetical protein